MADEKDCFTVPSALCLENTLGRKLIRVVDRVNNIPVRLGFVLYEVKVIHTSWTGPERGMGSEQVVRELLILPIPKISSMGAIRKTATPIGLDEVGSLQVSGISGRYTERQVMGLEIDGQVIGAQDQAYYEITFLSRGTQEKRRFSVSNTPYYDSEEFGWQVTLERARADRDDITGDPQ